MKTNRDFASSEYPAAGKRTNLFCRAKILRFSTIFIALLVCGSGPSLSEETVAVSEELAAQKIRQAKIIDPHSTLRVEVASNEEARVVVGRNPKASDEDCKIDAILLAKTLMEAFPGKLMRVKAIFTQSNADSGQITVTVGDIKSFKSGQLDKKALLDSIEFVKVGSSSLTEVRAPVKALPGLYQNWRQLLLDEIRLLANQDVNVTVFVDDFNQIEKILGTAGEREIKRRLLSLDAELKDQAELSRIARQSLLRMPGAVRPRRPLLEVHSRIQELAQQGKDVTPYMEQLKEIRRLKLTGRIQEANRLVNELSRTLGN